MEQVADLIVRLGEKANSTTQRDVARKIGISETQLTRLLKGERQPGSKTLAGIVQAYPDLLPYVSLFLAEKVQIGNGQEPIRDAKRP